MGLIYEAAPWWTVAWGALLLLDGLLPVAMVALTRPLVDGLAEVIRAGGAWETLQPLLAPAALMGLALGASALSQGLAGWVREVQGELVRNHITDLVQRQSAELDLAFYESPAYFDQLHQAREEAGSRPVELLESLGGLVQSGLTLAGMLVILLPYGLWVPAVLAASVLPAFYVVFAYNRRHHAWWERTTTDRRRSYYHDWLLSDSGAAAELRLFDLGGHFRALDRTVRRRLFAERRALLARQTVAQAASGLAAAAIGAGAVAWTIWRAVQGALSLGDLALFYQAFSQGQGLVRTMLGGLGQIYAGGLFLGNLFAFLDLRPQVADPAEPETPPAAPREGLRFRAVSFRYPGSERVALSDFSLELPAGRLTAIVGANGAGKSTLVKLLCRLYDPEGGAVEIDGVDIRRYRLADLRRMITVLFQSPVSYQATASENIAISNLGAAPDASAVEIAAWGAGAHEVIARLPEGYATQLGRWFDDGTDLSGGEWQRVALARAFLRRSPILVLDEPTSFMDSWAENEWLARFRSLVAGKTALIITHRFTTAMRADSIHVMDGGRIVESGSHAELLALGGRYAASWRAQVRDRDPEASEAAAEALARLEGLRLREVRR
jgi:ATP-binding cassette subfamily B protein